MFGYLFVSSKKKRRRKFLFILVSPLILQSCSSGLSKRLSLGYSPLCVRVKSLLSCLTVCDPMDCIAHQAPLSMGFSKQEYWSGLSCPPPGHLPHPGIEPTSLMSPALAGRLFTTEPPHFNRKTRKKSHVKHHLNTDETWVTPLVITGMSAYFSIRGCGSRMYVPALVAVMLILIT